MASFPDIDWFRRYARVLEQDPDFKAHGRWFRGSIAFRVDGRAVTLGFDDGLVTDVREGMAGADFVINGSAATWDRLLHQDITLLRVYRAGEIEIRGRNAELMKNWKAIYWIAEGMKAAEAAGGR
ncbi:MAG TPA: SCP2 sterol-binding domain-containing protein [Ramlibacter sp.]|nr:SCP2 sterol-binding domain-containing protein [Ramlibacter sp.]